MGKATYLLHCPWLGHAVTGPEKSGSIVNTALDDAEAQRVWAGMHANRRPDLVNGHFGDGIAFFLQDRQGLVAESQAFFLIIAIAHCKTVTFNSQPAFL